jgi:hypothetical protein
MDEKPAVFFALQSETSSGKEPSYRVRINSRHEEPSGTVDLESELEPTTLQGILAKIQDSLDTGIADIQAQVDALEGMPKMLASVLDLLQEGHHGLGGMTKSPWKQAGVTGGHNAHMRRASASVASCPWRGTSFAQRPPHAEAAGKRKTILHQVAELCDLRDGTLNGAGAEPAPSSMELRRGTTTPSLSEVAAERPRDVKKRHSDETAAKKITQSEPAGWHSPLPEARMSDAHVEPVPDKASHRSGRVGRVTVS